MLPHKLTPIKLYVMTVKFTTSELCDEFIKRISDQIDDSRFSIIRQYTTEDRRKRITTYHVVVQFQRKVVKHIRQVIEKLKNEQK